MPRLLAISGSLRASSSNVALLQAASLLAPPALEIELYEGLVLLPHFNPDLDTDMPPPPVSDLRARIGAADGLVISSPEYARGVPGSLKNALDWLVSAEDFAGKRVALFNASPRASHAQAALRLILETMSARILDEASLTVPLLARPLDATGIAADPALAQLIRGALAAFSRAFQKQVG
jgi:chromate reductase